jgi:hypothetical protein
MGLVGARCRRLSRLLEPFDRLMQVCAGMQRATAAAAGNRPWVTGCEAVNACMLSSTPLHRAGRRRARTRERAVLLGSCGAFRNCSNTLRIAQRPVRRRPGSPRTGDGHRDIEQIARSTSMASSAAVCGSRPTVVVHSHCDVGMSQTSGSPSTAASSTAGSETVRRSGSRHVGGAAQRSA